MPIEQRRYWFRTRRLGVGWSPATPEGWATLLAWLAIDLVGSRRVVARHGVTRTGARCFRLALVATLLAVGIATGEPLRR